MPASAGKKFPRKLNAKSAYVLLLCSSPILILFACLGEFYRGIGAWICAELILLVIWARWDLRKHSWFWITITFAAFLQIPFILFVPWQNRDLTWFSLLPAAVTDYAMVYGCIKLVEKLMKRSNEASTPI
jgi:hypothetical protein